VLTNMSYGT